MPARMKPRIEFGRGAGVRDPIDVQLGAKIRGLRTSHGLSQTELAQAVGVSFQQLQKYERGANRISVATLLRLCGAMKVSAAALIGELAGEHEAAEAPAEPGISLSGSRALLRVRSEPLRAAVIELLKSVARRGG
jgi:transcriptional regulator with XRE-family HTH domain